MMIEKLLIIEQVKITKQLNIKIKNVINQGNTTIWKKERIRVHYDNTCVSIKGNQLKKPFMTIDWAFVLPLKITRP